MAEADCSSKRCSRCREVKPADQYYKDARISDGLYSACRACCNDSKKKAGNKRWYERVKHTDEYKEKVAAYQAANRERKRAYDTGYAIANSEKKVAAARQWALENRDRRAAIVRAYDGRRRAVTREGISGPELADWCKKQKKVCYWCGAKCTKVYHVDHYMPLARGGKHEISNLVIACPPCNLRKNSKHPDDFAKEVGRLTISPEMVANC